MEIEFNEVKKEMKRINKLMPKQIIEIDNVKSK